MWKMTWLVATREVIFKNVGLVLHRNYYETTGEHSDTDTGGGSRHPPVKRGCPFSMISGKPTLYTSSEKPGLQGEMTPHSAAICGGKEGEGVRQ